MGHLDLYRIDRELLCQSGDERRGLRCLVDDVHNVAPVAPQHTAVVVQRQSRDAVRQPVDDVGSRPAEERILPVHPYRPDDVVPLIDAGHDARDLLRRVLKVRVHRDDNVPLCGLKARHDRHVLTKIAVEVYDPYDIWPFPVFLEQQWQGCVPATVVDEHHLKGPPQRIHDGQQPAKQRGQRLLLTVDRNNHRDHVR